VDVGKIGDDEVTLESPVSSTSWLSIFPLSIDGNRLGTYSVEVDRTNLPDGPYYAILNFYSDKNDVEIPVSMEVGDIKVTGDAGFHYVLLLKQNVSKTGETTYQWFKQVEVSASNGAYPFVFTKVPAGKYIVFAGTDSDNDYFIGDSGEAAGAYISLDQPSIVTVKDHTGGINFSTAFKLNLPAGASELRSPTLFPLQRKEIVGYHD
jgi:serine protease